MSRMGPKLGGLGSAEQQGASKWNRTGDENSVRRWGKDPDGRAKRNRKNICGSCAADWRPTPDGEATGAGNGSSVHDVTW